MTRLGPLVLPWSGARTCRCCGLPVPAAAEGLLPNGATAWSAGHALTQLVAWPAALPDQQPRPCLLPSHLPHREAHVCGQLGGAQGAQVCAALPGAAADRRAAAVWLVGAAPCQLACAGSPRLWPLPPCPCARRLRVPRYIPDFRQAFDHFCLHAGGCGARCCWQEQAAPDCRPEACAAAVGATALPRHGWALLAAAHHQHPCRPLFLPPAQAGAAWWRACPSSWVSAPRRWRPPPTPCTGAPASRTACPLPLMLGLLLLLPPVRCHYRRRCHCAAPAERQASRAHSSVQSALADALLPPPSSPALPRRYGNTSSSTVWYSFGFVESVQGVRRGDVVWQVRCCCCCSQPSPCAVGVLLLLRLPACCHRCSGQRSRRSKSHAVGVRCRVSSPTPPHPPAVCAPP